MIYGIWSQYKNGSRNGYWVADGQATSSNKPQVETYVRECEAWNPNKYYQVREKPIQ